MSERRRIERDLHDGAQQRLLALGLTLSRVQAAGDEHQTTDLLAQARAELTEALHELRDLARGLHPAVLTQLGLGPALEVIAERLPIAVELHIPPRRWPPALETTAYFVACEAIANAAKHAYANRIRVHVADLDGQLVLEINDDGRGGATPTGGTGLTGLYDRVAATGGTLTITSNPSEGTSIRAELPTT